MSTPAAASTATASATPTITRMRRGEDAIGLEVAELLQVLLAFDLAGCVAPPEDVLGRLGRVRRWRRRCCRRSGVARRVREVLHEKTTATITATTKTIMNRSITPLPSRRRGPSIRVHPISSLHITPHMSLVREKPGRECGRPAQSVPGRGGRHPGRRCRPCAKRGAYQPKPPHMPPRPIQPPAP